MKLLRAADRTAVAWKNGGGVTREIAGGPEGAGMTDFLWRVSLANVAADGPFSVFPGVDRILTMVEGMGMDLTLEDPGTGDVPGPGTRLVDTRYVPQHFPGDVPTHCRLLNGTVVNLNVMHRRGRASAQVEVVRGDVTITAPEQGTRIALPLDGRVVLYRHVASTLERYDAVLFAGVDPASYDPPGTFLTTGRTAVITLHHD
ncbi:HutD family protein [Streptomyces sp. NPDC051561]|uniref:HutD family protein n=1 Tax=Streptomyces sp. NPDC051561 TaxID=3365658 RepID=UPI0037AF8ACD